ncbi:BRO family protein [Lysinibacter sp. HNR]|uniref:BRO family protein n=1 Tax=Lysinibacter sp. HNR TaxID=3031408 RepID=UPI0024355103|nr:BRO family protein [Lysinibacter sp. HNR]WGD38506.1 BRO family protein [Lysinibacter sp. HNR]
MSNQIIPFNYNSHQVRVIEVNDEPWFMAADVCRVLEVGNPSQALTRLETEDVTLISNEGRPVNYISEYGLYALVLGSRKAEAKAFKRWITHEVIPQIRKTGSYSVAPTVPTGSELLALAVLEADKTIKAQAAQIAADAPKVEYHDQYVSESDDVITVRVAAAQVALGEKELREALIQAGWIYRLDLGQRWSNAKGQLEPVYEYRAHAEHKDKFQLRPQHNAPRHHNGQVRQTLYVRQFAVPAIAKRFGSQAHLKLVGVTA